MLIWFKRLRKAEGGGLAKGCILKSDDVDIERAWIIIENPFSRVVLIFNQKNISL